MSLKDKIMSGVWWSTVVRGVREVANFGVDIALARLLMPEDFGLLGMVLVFTGFANRFSDTGFGDALVQRENLEERHKSSVFWLNLLIGGTVTGGFLLGAPWLADLYGEPRLELLTMVAGLRFTITAFNIVQMALLQRSMSFKTLMWIRTAGVFTSGGIAVAMAATGWGVWALVAQILVATAVRVVGAWAATDWWPEATFEWKAIEELLEFSGYRFIFDLVNYAERNGDDLLVGKYVGSAGLGNYRRAYDIMLLPIRHLRSVIGNVMFPAFSEIQDEPERIKRIYLKVTRAIGLVSIPFMCFVLVLAEPIVLAVFGEHWSGVVPIVQILCITGVKQPVSTTTGWIFKGLGRTELELKLKLVSAALAAAAFAVGIQWGVIGMAIAYVVHDYLMWYPDMAIPGRLIDMTFREFVETHLPVFGCSLLAAGAVWAARTTLVAPFGPWLELAALVPFALAAYFLLIHFIEIRAYREGRELALEQWEQFVGE